MGKILVTLVILILLFWINKWHSEIIEPVLKLWNTTDDFNTNNNINDSGLVYYQLYSYFFSKNPNDYVST